jgi:hypothetical protein
MSDELRLPDDLAACEARLAARSPTPTQIDRDQLMYQAGWAACESQFIGASFPVAKLGDGPRRRGTGGGIIAAWSFASAALAASLAVALTLHLQQTPPANGVGAQVNQVVSQAKRADFSQAAPQASDDATLAKFAAFFTDGGQLPQSLIDRQRASAVFAPRTAWLASREASPRAFEVTPASAASDDTVLPPSKTISQLLNEFLPPAKRAPRQSTLFWPWKPASHGDTI